MTTLAASILAAKALVSVHSLALLQAQDMINSGNSKLLEVFIGLAAFALLVQAAAVVGVALGLLKAQKVVLAEIAEIKGKVLPFVAQTHGLVDEISPTVKSITKKTETLITDLTPHVKDITVKVQGLVADLSPQIVGITAKVHSIAGHVEEISTLAKDKVVEFGPTVSAANVTVRETNDNVRATVQDVNDKTRAQVARVNGMISGALDATAKIGRAIEHGITQPAREVSGFVTGTKVAVEHLYKRYGNLVNLGGLADLVGFGKKKAAPSPYTPPKPHATSEPSKPVASYAPEGMGASQSTLPSAFGSTRRDLDL